MKELNIPALIPVSEINRTAFIKDFNIKDDWEHIKSLLPHLEKLENLGLVVQTVAIRKTGSQVDVLMERVNGFELGSISEEYHDYRFSIDLAKKTAVLFQGFFEAGYYHSDPHSGNIMYDQKRGKCVAVDLDSLVTHENNDISIKQYVQDFSDLMIGLWLGKDGGRTTEIIESLLYREELKQYMNGLWEDFIGKISPYKQVFKDEDFFYSSNGADPTFREYSYIIMRNLIKARGLDAKIDPVVKDFILRGLNPATCPESFDEILRLKAEVDEKV